ncbi:unnamed protein product [Ceratitis capitata]|uniref:(Mediterranean fruit fly) hypothetical protein n=3 Tax=Ceratitis capitata TaxID=7213 RepID=A0A811UBZ9_CERCA|nr:unnamed protein product [Ceratitis capitata]
MSSVIVLDSSDEEEVPAKKAFIAPSIPATITPIKGNAGANQTKMKKTKPRPIPSGITITRRSPVNVSTSGPTTSSSNTSNSGIFSISPIDDAKTATISAATLAATTKLNSLMAKTTATNLLKVNSVATLNNAKERQTSTPPRHLAQQTIQKVQQTQQIATTTNKQLQQKPLPQMQQLQQGLPLLSQLPQLQPSPSVLRKRLSHTASPTTHLQQQQQQQQQQQPQPPKLQKSKQQLNPPKLQQQQQQQHQQKSPSLALDTQARKLNTPPATMTAIGTVSNISTTSTATLLPMISSVQSMAASATPPLQLLATPPHSAATTFSDQQLFSPKLMHTTCSLPPSTTVTAARTQVANSVNANYNSNSNTGGSVGYINNNNNKNFNNNFKIMLPPKSSNSNNIAGSNPATSMTPTPPTLATPVALQQANTGPRIAYVNSLATQISSAANKTNNVKNLGNFTSKSKTSAATASIVPIAITAAAQALPTLAMTPPATPASTAATSASATTNPLLGVRRVKPTTLLRKNDEAWQKRTTTPTTAITSAKKYNDDDLVLELLPHDSDNARTQSRSFTKAQQPAMQSLKTTEIKLSNKLSNVYTKKPASNKPAYPLKIDLTASPEKTTPSRRVETITISPTTSPTSATMAKNKSVGESVVSNGVGTVQPPKCNTPTGSEKSKPTEERLPLTSDYEELLKACREADASPDMEKLVKTKLVKYYYNVHPDFVRSKGFGKSLRTVITNIRKEPDLVYLHLKTIVDELKVRSKNKDVAPVALVKTEEEEGVEKEKEKTDSSTSVEKDKDKEKVKDKDKEKDKAQSAVSGSSSGPIEDISTSTGNKHTDEQIKKLNKALYILTKRIEVLESAEVDWDDEDSSYLQVERFKKRACQIYEKICDLTGESKNAHRLVKKPIHFNGTTYTQFNKTLQAFINRTREFPDYFDVLRMLEHCNRQYDYALASFEIKRIAHDAFMKVGKLLQSRRKTDLYETVTHFTAHEKDPAAVDAELLAKLSENQKKRTRISDVIEKYAREQDMAREELKEARQAKVAKLSKSEDDEADDDTLDAVASTSAHAAKAAELKKSRHKTENGKTTVGNENDVSLDDDDEDEDDEEEDDDEQVNGSDLDADVEKLANGELSDVESDTEIVNNKQATSDVITKVASRKEEEESIAQKNTHHKTSTTDAATDSASDSATTKTESKSVNIATNSHPVVTPNASKQTAAAPTPAKLPVNNNAMREKTAVPLANDAPKLRTVDMSKLTNVTATETTTVANGCAKPVTAQSGNNKPPPPPQQTTATQATGLKIVSVSSIKNVEIVDNKSQSNLVNPQSNQAKIQKPPNELKRQRTVAEIVISDEES